MWTLVFKFLNFSLFIFQVCLFFNMKLFFFRDLQTCKVWKLAEPNETYPFSFNLLCWISQSLHNCGHFIWSVFFSYFLLQLKYKRRVYKMLHMDEKQLKAINSKASKKKFNDHVLNNNVDKVNKMCAKGLDPNFHCQDSHTGGKAHYLSVSLLCNFWSDGLCSF